MKSVNPAFEQEVIPNISALFGMALKYTHSESEAEDLVQDVLVKAYRNFDSYDKGSNCRAWLFRILTNTFINKYRHQQRETAFIEHVLKENSETVEPFIDKTNENELCCEDRSDQEFLSEHDYFYAFPDEIVHAFKSISKEFRSIIILADLQELSYREIADKLHIPIGTVMSRLSRARQSMRVFLNDYAVSIGY